MMVFANLSQEPPAWVNSAAYPQTQKTSAAAQVFCVSNQFPLSGLTDFQPSLRVIWGSTGAGGGGSEIPRMPSLNPFRPSPSPLPNSGSRLAPNNKKATTANTIRCHG